MVRCACKRANLTLATTGASTKLPPGTLQQEGFLSYIMRKFVKKAVILV
jgi:hypothetical protein